MKFKQPVILLAAILLLIIAQYFFLSGWDRESGIVAYGVLWMELIAIALNAWLIYLMIKKLSSAASRGSRIGAYLGAYGVYPFAVILGIVVGGGIGGTIGETVFGGDAGFLVSIVTGIFIVTNLVCSAGALLGCLLGGLTHRFARYMRVR